MRAPRTGLGLRPRPPAPRACFCIGRQNGEPACPCRMRAMARERRGWLCDRCGNVHGPHVDSCPEGLSPLREVIR